MGHFYEEFGIFHSDHSSPSALMSHKGSFWNFTIKLVAPVGRTQENMPPSQDCYSHEFLTLILVCRQILELVKFISQELQPVNYGPCGFCSGFQSDNLLCDVSYLVEYNKSLLIFSLFRFFIL